MWLLSFRYGQEYNYAKQKEIPVLVFIKKDIESIPANKTDSDKNLKNKLLSFIEKVKDNRLVTS